MTRARRHGWRRDVPQPFEFAQELSTVTPELINGLIRAYKSAYRDSYLPPTRSGMKEKVSGGDVSDPTGNLVVEGIGNREHPGDLGRLKRAATATLRALRAIDDASKELSRITGKGSERAEHRAGEVTQRCRNCRGLQVVSNGLCRNCDQYERRKNTPRPAHLVDREVARSAR